jgi:DNA-binding NarL/FixJ family response regulator
MLHTEKNILILDQNRLFMWGLSLLLEHDAGIGTVMCCHEVDECLLKLDKGCVPDLFVLGSLSAASPEHRLLLSWKLAQHPPPVRILEVTESISSRPFFEVSPRVTAQLTRRHSRHTFLRTISDLFTLSATSPGAPPSLCTRSVGSANHHFSFLLNEREITVLKYFLRGLPLTQIAYMLSLSIKTVSYYKLSAQQKLGLKNNQDIYYYFRNLPVTGRSR